MPMVEQLRMVARTPELTTVDVLGVQVGCVGLEDILACVRSWIPGEERRSIFYVNAHCLNVAEANALFRTVLNAGDLVYADGVGAVWAGKLLGGCGIRKATGADWIERFCDEAVENSWRIYIVAGAPGVALAARERLLSRYPSLQIAGVSDGFCSQTCPEDVVRDIEASSPHVVFVGMGTPQQELWIARHRSQISAPVCWAVGALFDYVAGIERRAPLWMRSLALEWLWRLLVDPVGKWKRYLFGAPVFIYHVLRQRSGKNYNAPTT